MKNSGFTQQCRLMLGKYRLAWAILTLTSLFFVQNLWGQGACGSITFSFEQYEPCKFRARYQNGTDCYSEVRYILESGTFESWNVNAAAGFTVDVISPSELWVHHVNGFLPLGIQAPLLFTLPTDLNTTMYVAYIDDCFQVGCEVFGGFPIESCPDPQDASIIGVKYRECGSLPYGNQTPLGGWTIQAIDTLGNIWEGVTEADGTYAIYDLPRGRYIVREAVQPGWTPKVPASGEYIVNLAASQQVVRNFGNCPSCSCDDIYMDVVQLPSSNDTCTYALSFSNNGEYCFSDISISLASGAFDEVTPATGWQVMTIDSQHIIVKPEQGYILRWWNEPCRFRPRSAAVHEITVSTSYNIGMGNISCSRAFSYPCPPPKIPPPCCPAGSQFGPELAKNGDFELGNQDFTNDYTYFAPGGSAMIGEYSVLNASQVYAANNQWACVDHTTFSPTGKMLIVDGYGGPIAWQQQVSVTAGTTYSFYAWFNNLVQPPKDYDDPQMALFVGNTQVAVSPVLHETPDRWERLCGTFTAQQTGLVTLYIQMLATTSTGNDVAIDDISFRECIPPPICECPPNAFSNMSYKPNSGPNVPISCGQIAIWQCLFPTFNLSGNFMCQGNGCPPMPPISWTLNHPNLGQVDQGISSSPGFQVSIANSSFPAPGLYTLSLVGICGEDTCYCEIFIETPGCGSNCTADFSAQYIACGKFNFSGFANGTPGFTYSWNFGDPNSGANNTSNLQNPMHQFSAPGNYTVTLTITDALGCVATYSATINVPSFPTSVSITGNPGLNICQGQSTTLTAGGGNWVTCQWSNSGSGTSITVNAPGTYCVTCTDANMCTATGCATVTQSPAPTVTITGPNSLCVGGSGNLTAIAPAGSTFVWQPSGSTNASIPISSNTPGVYGVMVTATLNGCTASAVATYTIHALPAANAGPDQLICQWQIATLTATGGGTYQWSPSGSTSNPYLTPSVQANSTYTVTVTDGNGCTATDQVNVNIIICDCETNPMVQNGGFTQGNPCTAGDEDIGNATSWSSIWPDYENGISTGDFYNTTTCTPTAFTYGVLTTPAPMGCGNFAGFWCHPNQEKVVWREGIMNNLTPTNLIAPNSGTYMLSMKMACLYNVNGTPRMSVYGVYQNAVSTVPSPKKLTTSTPTNPDLFSLNNQPGAVLLGKVFVPKTCNNNYTDVGITFNANILSQPIDRIFLTRDDNIGTAQNPNWGGFTYLAVDSFCVKPVFDSMTCDCGPLNFAYMYRPQDGWISPIGASQAAITAPCPKPAATYYILGQFQCAPDQCGNNCVNWKLDRPGPLADLTGQNCGAGYPWFVIPINNADCSLSGNYVLTITRMCGSMPCTKVFNFKIDNCPCPCDSLKQDVGYGFSMSSVFFPPNQCRKRFKPLALCPNDAVQWFITELNGPYTATGTSTGNASFQFSPSFTKSGYYGVCMVVTRTEPNGIVCKWEYCRTVYIQCGIDPVGPATRFCKENGVKNGGFNEVSSPGLLNEWGYLAHWDKVPNPGDGMVIVEDTSSAGSLDEGYVLLVGRKDNFAGIMQEVNLQPDTYLALYFDVHNYQGADLPAGTRIEVRLQDSPFPYPDLKKQVLKVQPIADSSGWHQIGGVTEEMLDTSLHYLVICLQNDDETRNSVVGLDNIEICSSPVTAAPEAERPRHHIRIFPNPNPGTFTVELPEPAKRGTRFRITDLAGRMVQEQETELDIAQQTVQAGALPNGLYFLQVVSEGKVLAVEKFVKQ